MINNIKLTRKYIHLKSVYGIGEGEIGFIKHLLNITGTLNILNFIKLYFPSYSDSALKIMPIAIISYVVFGFILGTILDKRFKIVDEQNKWRNIRNPEIMAILKRLDKIEKNVR